MGGRVFVSPMRAHFIPSSPLSLLSLLGCLFVLTQAPVAAAQDAPIFDDGFLVIQLDNEVQSRGGNQPSDVNYHPMIRMRFFGAVEAGDAVKIRWRRGRRTLAEIRCPLQSRQGDWRTGLSDRCWNRDDVQLTAHGDVEVDVTFVDDSAETETLVRTLRVPVGRYWSWDRTVGRRQIYSPRYQVRGDDLLGLSYVWLRDPSRTEPRGQVYFYYWATLANDDTNYRDPSWRCRLDGEAVPELNVDGHQAIESISDIRITDVQRQGNTRESTHYSWRLMWVKPQMVWGPQNSEASDLLSTDRYNLTEHPGAYVCRVRNEGEMVREFHFTVTPEGTIAPHPVQAGGELSLRPGAFFVETHFPRRNPAEMSFDRAAVRGSVGFGRSWPNDPAVRSWLQSLPPTFGQSEPRAPRGAR